MGGTVWKVFWLNVIEDIFVILLNIFEYLFVPDKDFKNDFNIWIIVNVITNILTSITIYICSNIYIQLKHYYVYIGGHLIDDTFDGYGVVLAHDYITGDWPLAGNVDVDVDEYWAKYSTKYAVQIIHEIASYRKPIVVLHMHLFVINIKHIFKHF